MSSKGWRMGAVARALVGATLIVFLVPADRARGDVFTWTNAAGDWFSAANWTNQAGLNGVPGGGDTALVGAGADILLTNQTGFLNAFEMSGGILTFTNWMTRLRGSHVTVTGGTLTLPAPFAETAMSNRVWIVCTNFVLGSAATINADKLGYDKQNGPGKPAGVLSTRGGGAGHGGVGGVSDSAQYGGIAYGSVHQPSTPGSGSNKTTNKSGNPGGGVVRVEAAGHVLINGIITADGDNTDGLYTIGRSAGAGAGGSIWITCATFAGTNGQIEANGADGWVHSSGDSGGGGGGRIAVHYDTGLQASMPLSSVRFRVSPGRGYQPRDVPPPFVISGQEHFTRAKEPDWGSIYLSDTSGVVRIPEALTNAWGYLTFGNDATNLALSGMTLENAYFGIETNASISFAGDLTIATNGALLARTPLLLSVAGDLLIQGELRLKSATTVNCSSNVRVSGVGTFSSDGLSAIDIGGELVVSGSTANVIWQGADTTVGGDLELQNGGWLAVMGLSTNGAVDDAGMRMSAGGDLRLQSNCWIYVYSDPVDGGSPALYCAGLSVPVGAGFQGDTRGYNQERGPGAGKHISTLNPASGAGHGGAGGDSSTGSAGGITNGGAMFPLFAGSGGGYTGSAVGGRGGGSIRLRASQHAQIDGILTVNGGGGDPYGGREGGGGAGGSILLAVASFAGGADARMYANGGIGPTNLTTGGGGGAGGRIAIWTHIQEPDHARLLAGAFDDFETNAVPAAFSGSWSVGGGSGYEYGGDGSVVFGRPPPAGTVFNIL